MSTPSTDVVRVQIAADYPAAIWERDDAHPGGELFLTPGAPPARAARTDRITALLASGALSEVPDGDPVDVATTRAPAAPSAAPEPHTRPTPRATRPSRTDGTR